MTTTAAESPLSLPERWEAAQQVYGGKVRTFARNSFRQIPDHDQADMEQEILIVLWQCVQKYDPNNGASFNTLFQQCAKNRIISLIRHYSTKSRTAAVVSLGEEAVAAAVDEYLAVHSAEELAMMRLEINTYVTEFGVEVLDGNRRHSRSAA
jgi:RNA polymerase sigma factor (sigma-70 family)